MGSCCIRLIVSWLWYLVVSDCALCCIMCFIIKPLKAKCSITNWKALLWVHVQKLIYKADSQMQTKIQSAM